MLTFLQERGGLRICIYIQGLHRVGRRTFNFKQFKTRIVFPVQTAGKSSDVVWLSENLPRSPLKLHMKQTLVTQGLARFRCC